MNDKVGFKEVQAYAQTHNIDFKTAAKQMGLTEAQAKALEESMNGGVNWGKVMDEVSFNPDKAETYAKESAAKTETEQPNTKVLTFESNTQRRARLNEEAAEHKENMKENWNQGKYADAAGDFFKGMWAAFKKESTPTKDGVQEAGFGKVLVAAALAGIAFASCSKDPNVISQNVSLIIITKDSSLKAALDKILLELQGLGDGQNVSNQTLAAILEREIANGMTSEQILSLVNGNQQLLQRILDAACENNDLLDDVVANQEASQVTQEAILDAIVQLQNSIDVLTQLAADTNSKIPDDLKGDLNAILNAIKDGNASLESINKNVESLAGKLAEVSDDIKANGKTQEEIKAILEKIQSNQVSDSEKLLLMLDLLKSIESISSEINDKLTEITNTVNEINNKFDNDKDIAAALDKLMQLVQQNNDKADVTNDLLEKLISMYENSGGTGGITKEDIAAIIDAIAANGDKIDATNQLLAKIQDQDEKFQAAVLKELKNIGEISMNIFNQVVDMANGDADKFNQIMQMLAKMQDQDEKYQTAMLEAIKNLGNTSIDILNKVIESVSGNTEKMDAIVQLLAKIDNNIQQYGEAGKELGNKILAAIEKFGADISGKLTQILNVVNQDADNGKNIQDLLNKVLSKMDENTEAIIDAIGNIKIGDGGAVDLSSLEKMLSELLQLTSKNNGLLESIDGKMDVINLTIERAKDEILAKMDKNDANTQAILAKLDEFMNLSNANSEAILKKMDTIINVLNNIKDSTYDDSELMSKLDDILAAIKDHDITVNLEGKVTCNCNCGGNHEGIIGNLDQILK